MENIEDLKIKLKKARESLVGSHFKYNKMGFIINQIYSLSKYDIKYAKNILEKIENGVIQDELNNELLELQKSEEKKYINIIEDLENKIENIQK